MYQSSSSSFSEVATPRGRKSLRAHRSQMNGKGAARAQKEKNGTIVKDELVLFDKEGMHPDVLHFFEDELEKQAFGNTLNNLLLKGVKSQNKVVRKVSNEAARAWTSPHMQRLSKDTAQYAANPNFGSSFYTHGTIPGHAAHYAGTRAGIPEKYMKALTWNLKNNPL